MQVQMKRLEQHQQNISEHSGSNTDSEFRQLFQELYSEIRNKMEKHDNKICYWDNCNVDSEFDTRDLLMKHVKDIYLTTVSQSDVAPIDRHYLCEWLGCGKQFGKSFE
jgi:hypothetical protein